MKTAEVARRYVERGRSDDAQHAGKRLLAGATALVVLIAGIDYFTGIELRVYPLYFLPVSLAAARGGRRAGMAIAMLSMLGWLVSNELAGQTYSHPGIWVWNTAAQGIAFSVVALLISSLQLALQRERGLSRTDALTGLLNSRAFHELAPGVLSSARRHGRTVALAYIDVDDFKQVNDTLGHSGGDDVLRLVGRTLADSVRDEDLAVRLGGDEFGVLLGEIDAEGAQAFLERIRTALEARLQGMPSPVTLSVGAAVFEAAPSDLETLLRRADALMYGAKARGKNRVEIAVC